MYTFRDYSSILPLTSCEAERLLSRIRIDDNGCWIWTGSLNAKGYGTICLRARHWATHRLLYVAMIGHVATYLVLDHLCRVPACCNPWHLEVVTQAVNIQRADMPSGANHCNGRLTHCKYGHPFSGDNVYYYEVEGHVYRVCRTCAARRTAKHRRRRNAALRAARLAQRGIIHPETGEGFAPSHSSHSSHPSHSPLLRVHDPFSPGATGGNCSCYPDPADLYLLSLRETFPVREKTL